MGFLETASWFIPGVSLVRGANVAIDAADQAQDMNAMGRHMAAVIANTSAATKLLTEWNVWFHGLSWYERNVDEQIWMLARNKVNQFNLANASNSDERDAVMRQIQQGGKFAQVMAAGKGESLPVNAETGMFEISQPSSPLKMKWVWLGGTFASLGVLGTWLAPGHWKIPAAAILTGAVASTGTYVAFKADI